MIVIHVDITTLNESCCCSGAKNSCFNLVFVLAFCCLDLRDDMVVMERALYISNSRFATTH